MYLKLLKALCMCVKSALLKYELLTATLQDFGCELNPYDECVANKVINEKQYIIACHLDNNKIFHVDENVVLKIISDIEDKFGKMSVTRGNKHVFLGMNIIFNKNITATIMMKEYLEEAIDDFGEDIVSVTTSPAQKRMFAVD